MTNETPKCQNCGRDDQWVIGRQLEERKTWVPETGIWKDEEIVCSDLWVFCAGCNLDADEEDLIYQYLENK